MPVASTSEGPAGVYTVHDYLDLWSYDGTLDRNLLARAMAPEQERKSRHSERVLSGTLSRRALLRSIVPGGHAAHGRSSGGLLREGERRGRCIATNDQDISSRSRSLL
jgi:hypothetical protein